MSFIIVGFRKLTVDKMSKTPRTFMTLKQFMLRQEVLKLYREVHRTARKVEPSQRADIIFWARTDIETHKTQTDEFVIKRLLTSGRDMVKELQKTIKKAT